MIKLCLAALIEMGFAKTQVYTTLEFRMKCGVGKCGRCNVGNKYVCKDNRYSVVTKSTNYQMSIEKKIS